MRYANREPSLLIVAVRTAKYDWSIEDFDRVVEIDAVFDAIKFVLLFVPIEGSQDQFSYLFVRHNPHSRPEETATFIALLPGCGGPLDRRICIYIRISQKSRQICVLAVSRAALSPVNSGEKANNSRILRRSSYIHGRLAPTQDSRTIPHALYAPIPR